MGKTSQKEKREKRLAGRVSLALAAGMFSVVPVAHGMPTLDEVKHGGANIGPTIADPAFAAGSGHTLKNITSNENKNVIHWKDFSIAEKEHVHFDAHDYMNVVTGKATSAIDGIMDGGKNVYLINPNGVIFGAKAQVNVGNLYVSTRRGTDAQIEAMENAFVGGTATVDSVLANLPTAPTAEVVSLIDKNGYVAATEVVMEGRNIRFLNANALAAQDAEDVRVVNDALSSTVTSEDLPSSVDYDSTTGVFSVSSNPEAANVTFRANAYGTEKNTDNYGDGYVHVGSDSGAASNYTAKSFSGTTDVVNYKLVRTAAELQAINNNKSTDGKKIVGNYMLANNINAIADATDPTVMTSTIAPATATSNTLHNIKTGVPFTGKFDGMYFTVSNLNKNSNMGLTQNTSYAGLFGYTSEATIENVGVENANFQTYHAGGIVGYANDTVLRNVWNAGGSGQIGASNSTQFVGGIAGIAAGTTQLTNAYNEGTIKGAGLIGTLYDTSGIRNAYNTGILASATGKTNGDSYGIYNTLEDSSKNKVINVYTASSWVHAGESVSGIVQGVEVIGKSPTTGGSTNKIIKSDADVTAWLNALNGSTKSYEGGSGATWRYYLNLPTTTNEERKMSLPKLTAFFKGVVSTDYDYSMYNADGTLASWTNNSLAQSKASGVASKVYDAHTVSPYKYVEAEDGDYVQRAGAGYVLFDGNLDDANATRYAKLSTSAAYLGANADSSKITEYYHDQKYVLGAEKSFALYASDQQGYDLYGNNFKITKRTYGFDANSVPSSYTKVYDGSSDATAAVKDAFSSAGGALSGLCEADKTAGLKVSFGDNFKATFYTAENGTATKNVANATKIYISGADSIGLTGSTNTELLGSYKLGTVSNVNGWKNGTITKRKVAVGLAASTGIDKTYDGTANVRNEGDGANFLPTENGNVQVTNLATPQDSKDVAAILESDGVKLYYANMSATYEEGKDVQFDTSGAVRSQNVNYTGIALTATAGADDLANYELVKADGTALTSGTLTGTGTIKQRPVGGFGDAQNAVANASYLKSYDNKNYKDLGGTPEAVTTTDLATADEAAEGTKLTGLIGDDKDVVTFQTSGKAYYYDASGNLTMDATDSGLDTAATYAIIGVEIANPNADAAKNYIVDTTSGARRNAVNGVNLISKIDATIALKQATGINKEYDGTTKVSGSGTYASESFDYATGNYTISGLVAGDSTGVKITSATYGDKNVVYTADDSDTVKENGKTITYALSLTGDRAANYNLHTATNTTNTTQSVILTATGKITPKNLTVSFNQVAKSYDTTPDVKGVEASDKIALAAPVTLEEGDGSFDVTKVTAQYGKYDTDNNNVFVADADVGANKPVQFTNLHGALGGNYKNYKINNKTWKTSNTIYGAGEIRARKITVGMLAGYVKTTNDLNKEYDGKTYYDGVGSLSAKDFLAANDAAIDDAYTDATVAAKLKAEVQDCIEDYMSIAEAVYKSSGNAVKDVGNDYVVDTTFRVSDGTTAVNEYFDIDNFSFQVGDFHKNLTGDITPKKVRVTLDANQNPEKVYDGTTEVKATGYSAGFGFVADDLLAEDKSKGITLNKAAIAAVYDGSDVSDDRKVIYSNIKFTDTAAAKNYILVKELTDTQAVNTIEGAGTITARRVRVASVGDVNKVYDDVNGSAAVTANPSITLADDENDGVTILADQGKTSITNLSTVAGNYGALSGGTFTANGNVNRTSGTAAAQKKDIQYTGVENFLGANYVLVENGSGTVNGDTVTTKPIVTKAGDAYYVYGKGTIIPANKTVNVSVISKEYDGTASISKDIIDRSLFKDENNAAISDNLWNKLTISGTYGSSAGNEAAKDVATGKTLNNFTMGIDEGDGTYNYNLTTNAAPTGTITARKIYAYINKTEDEQRAAVKKTYDGTTTISGQDTVRGWLALSRNADGTGTAIVGNEDVSIDTDAFTVAYKNKNAGEGVTVLYGGTTDATTANPDGIDLGAIALTGTAAGNYALQVTTLTGKGDIDKRSITVQFGLPAGKTKADKLYDGNANVTNTEVAAANNNPATNDIIVPEWQDASVIVEGDNLSIGGTIGGTISGVYGTWTPGEGDAPGTFVSNANVHNSDNSTTKDVLYYGFALAGTDKDNYELTNGKSFKLDGIDKTVYFQEYANRGEIKPLSITMEKVRNDWKPIAKVYDGTTHVVSTNVGTETNPIIERVYDINGNEITDLTKFLTIYYDKNDNGIKDTGEVEIPYISVADANYEASDAGKQAVTYTGFTFGGTIDGNFTVIDDNYSVATAALNAIYNNPNNSTPRTTPYTTSPAVDKRGTIAKRLLVVDADNTPLVNGDNTMIYNGDANLVAAGTAYTANLKDTANNPNASGLVGDDEVSITYVANFTDGSKNADVDSDAVKPVNGDWTRDVTYTFTLADKENKDFAKNYTLVKGGDATTATDTRKGAIRKREVYVDFVSEEKGKNINKAYDKTSTALIGEDMSTVLKPLAAVDNADTNTHTGIVAADVTAGVALDYANVKANYVDANGKASADSDAKLSITTRKVYFQNLNLTGTGAGNYVVKAKDHAGNEQAKAYKTPFDATDKEQTLVGEGSIAKRKIEVETTGTTPTKIYDTTKDVLLPADANGQQSRYVPTNGKRTLVEGDSYITLVADGVSGTTDGKLDGDMGVTYSDANITVESALYSDPNAATGLGVTYKLKVNSENYELVHYAIDGNGNKTNSIAETGSEITMERKGDIQKKTITVSGNPVFTKIYDGTPDVNISDVPSTLFGDGVYDQDKSRLLKDVSAKFGSSDTLAAADSVEGAWQKVTIDYTLNDDPESGTGRNYQLDDGNTTRSGSYVNNTGGRINRAQVTLTPTEISYQPDQVANATYTGSVSSNGAAFTNPVTFGRLPNDTSTVAGNNYTLVGYVNDTAILPGDNRFINGYNNYYFVTPNNGALHIVANPQNTEVIDAVQDAVIADKKFTPDDYSYNRMSKDQDLTRVNRQSSAAVQYAEKGVNLDGDDTKSGLSALADIRGAGSVVNLNGALIQTSAPAEQPEKVAEAAALPMSETGESATLTPLPEREESDISSIDLEYADNTSGSQSVLEILTNASNNAEKKGTSIVIDTQDEDEEDAEEEKSRRAIFADRSNIGIETLGDAVNLNQMIG